MHLQLYFAKYFLLGCIFGKIREKEIMEEKNTGRDQGFYRKSTHTLTTTKQRNIKQKH